jgi:hypothetical protein
VRWFETLYFIVRLAVSLVLPVMIVAWVDARLWMFRSCGFERYELALGLLGYVMANVRVVVAGLWLIVLVLLAVESVVVRAPRPATGWRPIVSDVARSDFLRRQILTSLSLWLWMVASYVDVFNVGLECG